MSGKRFETFGSFATWLRTKIEYILTTLNQKLDKNGDGTNLTNLNASALATGTVPLARLGSLGNMVSNNIITSTAVPTDLEGADGDIWFLYEGDPLVIKVTAIQGSTVNYNFTDIIGNGITVDWGDGEVVHYDANIDGVKTYPNAGEYNALITGNAEKVLIGSIAITEVIDWGNCRLGNISFYGCQSLMTVPNALPPHITDLRGMFDSCTSFNQNLSTWDTSNVTNMSAMFNGCTTFNQDLSGWNVSKVTLHIDFDAGTSVDWLSTMKPVWV